MKSIETVALSPKAKRKQELNNKFNDTVQFVRDQAMNSLDKRETIEYLDNCFYLGNDVTIPVERDITEDIDFVRKALISNLDTIPDYHREIILLLNS